MKPTGIDAVLAQLESTCRWVHRAFIRLDPFAGKAAPDGNSKMVRASSIWGLRDLPMAGQGATVSARQSS
jgi:hypothetical protein